MVAATYSAPNFLHKLHSAVLKLPLRREQAAPLLGRERRLPPPPPPRGFEPASASKHALRQEQHKRFQKRVWSGTRGAVDLREETTTATTTSPAAAVTPTATAVFQRPPPARGPPRRPAATRSTQPHAHIGRRCPADRSTAPPPVLSPPPPVVPSIGRFRPPGDFFVSGVGWWHHRDFEEVVRGAGPGVTDGPRSWPSRITATSPVGRGTPWVGSAPHLLALHDRKTVT